MATKLLRSTTWPLALRLQRAPSQARSEFKGASRIRRSSGETAVDHNDRLSRWRFHGSCLSGRVSATTIVATVVASMTVWTMIVWGAQQRPQQPADARVAPQQGSPRAEQGEPPGTVASTSEVDKQRRLARLAIYQQQLAYAAHGWRDDPSSCLRILTDPARCPSEFRDFAWGLYKRLAERQYLSLAGPSSQVTALDFSPDGTWLASGNDDGTVDLWDMHAGELKRSLKGHASRIGRVQFSPDGTLLLSHAEDGARFWDVVSGRLAGTLAGQEFVTFMPDNHRVISVVTPTADGDSPPDAPAVIKFWAVPRMAAGETQDNWNPLSPWESTANPVAQGGYTSPRLSPDGSVVAHLTTHKTVLCDTQTGAARLFLSALHEPCRGQFSPDGRLFFLLAVDEGVHLYAWDSATGELKWRVYGGFRYMWEDMVVSPNGRTLAVLEIGAIGIRDAATGQEIRKLGGDGKVALTGALACSPDGQLLAAGNQNSGITILAAEPPAEASLVLQDSGSSRFVEGTVLVPREVSRAQVVDVASGKTYAQVEIGRDPPSHLCDPQPLQFSVNERALLLAPSDPDRLGARKSWSLPQGTMRAAFPGGRFSPDGRWLVSTDSGCVARLRDAATGRHLRNLIGAKAVLWEIGFSPNGQYAVVSAGGQVLWWRVDDPQGALIASHEAQSGLPLFSADCRLLALCVAEDVVICQSATGNEVARLAGAAADSGTPVAFAPDNQALVIQRPGEAAIWDAGTCRELCRFQGDKLWFCQDNEHVLVLRTVAKSEGQEEIPLALETANRQSIALEEEPGATDSGFVFDPVEGSLILSVRERRSGAVVMETRQEVLDKQDRLAVAGDGTAVALVTAFNIETWRYVRDPRPSWEAVLPDLRRELPVDVSSPPQRPLAEFSADGKYLTVMHPDGTGEVWNVDSAELYARLPAGEGTVASLAFSPSGRRLAIHRVSRGTEVYDAERGICRRLLAVPATQCDVSPDGNHVAIVEPTRVGLLSIHASEVTEPRYDPATESCSSWQEQTGLLMVAEKGQARFLAPGKDDQLSLVRDDAITPCRAVFAREKSVAALVGRDNRLLVWRFGENGTAVTRTNPVMGAIEVVWLSPDGRTVGAIVDSTETSAPSAPGASNPQTRPANLDIAGASDVSPLLSDYQEESAGIEPPKMRHVGLWDAITGAELARIDVAYCDSELPSFAPDGSLLLAPRSSTSYGVWRVPSGQRTAELTIERAAPNTVRSYGFSPQGGVVAIGTLDDGQLSVGARITFYDTRSGRALWNCMAEACVWDPRGENVALATPAGLVHIKDVVSGVDRMVLQDVENRPIRAIAITRDARTLAAADSLGVVTLWSLETGQQLARLIEASRHVPAHSEFHAAAFEFSASGRHLVLRDVNGLLVVWPQSRTK